VGRHRIPSLLLLVMLSLSSVGQSVGLVLSGGGSKGLAHIGVIKALEERQIPIDFITGTSTGAIIGGLYASGYTAEEIQAIFLSDEFIDLMRGIKDEDYNYYFKKEKSTASWVEIPLDLKDFSSTTLPTNLVAPSGLNFEMMAVFEPAGLVASNNFDQLMIPFRCVASDIENKESIIFREGNLTEAIRASMSYPFYFRPITVEGQVLFDGGLYNNFPADIMHSEFRPGVIIGSNVSGNEEPPTEDDIISILRNMMVSKSNYSLDSNNGVLIEPNVPIGAFDFENLYELIDSGYLSTIRKIDAIELKVERRRKPEQLSEMRAQFNDQKTELRVSDVEVRGVNENQAKYIQHVLHLNKKDDESHLEGLKMRYHRLSEDDKIVSLFPKLVFNEKDTSYTLILDVDLNKEFKVDFGGNFSSRPINTGYVGLHYNHLGKLSYGLHGTSYFGKFYNSAELRARIDFPTRFTFSLQPFYRLSRYNFFQSLSTFFELDRPSFLVQNETFYGLDFSTPTGSNSKLMVEFGNGEFRDDYYQTDNFSTTDVPDRTSFPTTSVAVKWEKNTFNYKQYPNQGLNVLLSLRYNNSVEKFRPGSTSVGQSLFESNHEWAEARFLYDHYFKQRGVFRLGGMLELVYSGLGPFNNYTASVLRAPSFEPIPITRTLFLESFRAYQYAAAGAKVIFDLKNRFDLRLEGYLLQPYRRIDRQNSNEYVIEESFERRFTMASATLVYQSPLGPLSFAGNYYFNINETFLQESPFIFYVQFGYLIFNKRALD